MEDKLLDLVNFEGQAAIHIALPLFNMDLLDSILHYGGNPNIQCEDLTNPCGDYPIHIAVKTKNIEALKILASYDANFSQLNTSKLSPWDIR